MDRGPGVLFEPVSDGKGRKPCTSSRVFDAEGLAQAQALVDDIASEF
ncbi:MAG: hypothetical protein AAGC53_21140 [Actinomycetota bacterium]